MTYQGARAQPADSENKKYFQVSKIHLNSEGRATQVLWREVNAKSNGAMGAPVVVPVADVVDAIHDGAHVSATLAPPHRTLPERVFEVLQLQGGFETIDLVLQPLSGISGVVTIKDIAALNIAAPHAVEVPKKLRPQGKHTYAVAKVLLDLDGRITDVYWGRIHAADNHRADSEVLVPVAVVVAALQAGDLVFALFPKEHGHLPKRKFVQADYDDGRQTIVLMGPAEQDRDIHDMARIPPAKPHRPVTAAGKK